MKKISIVLLLLSPFFGEAQTPGYWQQKVKYTMSVDVNAGANQFKGRQQLEYWNNSPDTLTSLYYHLYWNAFQPGSMMDERSRRQGSLQKPGGATDWDGRVKDRIQKLKDNEIGYQKIISLKMNGMRQSFQVQETILKVTLTKPIAPKTKVLLEMEFEAQVPLQVRRSGRDNAEGVRFSMSQWYPKLCEYDKDGWHANPYIAREFYGVWGDFDVKISIDKDYLIAATGYLQNPQQIGYGYEQAGTKVVRPAGKKLNWHFVAPNVHDFVWAADPEYIHLSKKLRDDLTLHAFYKFNADKIKDIFNGFSPANKERYGNSADSYVHYYKEEWESVLEAMAAALPFIEKTFGPYPYKQYSFIQGGDGGMEYPMATLLKGAGIETVVHEFMHSWYQMILATDEAQYPWMDEGFTTYAEDRVLNFLFPDTAYIHRGNYAGYNALVKSGKEEPLTTHADHYELNFAYSIASYSKGAIFLSQLGYIVGNQVLDKILLSYYNQWKFKHPDANDFIRVAEKTSGIELDWYKEYWVNTTKTIDYAIDSLWQAEAVTKIRLSRIGLMPMPIDLQLTFKDGTKEIHYIPLDLMYAEKPTEENGAVRKTYRAWPWTRASYIIETNRKLLDIVTIEIDSSQRMADIDRKNNKLELKW